MKPDIQRFVSPWKFRNSYGLPEVPIDDITIEGTLGSGKKASTSSATLNGKPIALKCWKTYSRYDNAEEYAQWEIQRYCDLREVQGTLIPKLYFISKNKSGKRLLGLEMGKVARESDDGFHDAMRDLRTELRKFGWQQRNDSWRADNVVWMKNDDGSKRLVAIDLESFIPYFGSKLQVPQTLSHQPNALFGLPEVSPAELNLQCSNSNFEWVADSYFTTVSWRYPNDAVVQRFDCKWEFTFHMERLEKLKVLQGRVLPVPLFLARQRSGTILLGYKAFEGPENLNWKNDYYMFSRLAMKASLATLGWTYDEYRYYLKFGAVQDGGVKRLLLVNSLTCLGEIDTECQEGKEDSSTPDVKALSDDDTSSGSEASGDRCK